MSLASVFKNAAAVAVIVLGWVPFMGCRPFSVKPIARPTPTAVPSEGPFTYPSRGARANAGILSEMISVIFSKSPRGGEYFFALVNVMNQGASIEGIYHGWIYTVEYLDLEHSGPAARAEQLRLFSEELVELERALSRPTSFSPRSGLPRDRILPPGVNQFGDNIGQAKYPLERIPDFPLSNEISLEHYLKIFTNGRSYTLKRVLGEEALKVIREYSARGPQALSEWYARWAVRLAGKGVDFGLADRNRSDLAFHKEWAIKAGLDLLTWEVLNRLHRLMNAAGGPVPSSPATQKEKK